MCEVVYEVVCEVVVVMAGYMQNVMRVLDPQKSIFQPNPLRYGGALELDTVCAGFVWV